MTAAAMTYDSLVSDIALYAERQNDTAFIAQIPRLIMMAENRLAAEVRGLGFLKVVSSAMTSANPVIVKPERWRETVTLQAVVSSSLVTVLERSYEYCTTYTPNPATTGTPRYYCDYDYEHFYIVPTPATAIPFRLRYYERPLPLSDSNQTSWTTQYAPQLLLYGALLEAQPFIKNAEMAALWKTLYQEAVASVAAEAKRRAFDRSTGIRE